jgi:hypothetical protein
MPWVKGYKWYRSRSHAHSDVCDEYANEDHDGLGEGVFKKANVPDKPHPQCLCYIVAVSMDDKDWLKAYNAGRFNQYLGMRVAESGVGEYLTSTFLNKTGQVFGQAAGMVAVSAGYSALERMTRPGGLKNVGFNPVAMKRAVPSARGEMAAAAQAEYYMDDNDPSAWGSADNSHPMAEGNARLERALRSVDNDLAQRQSAFKRLGYTSLEQRWREAYARDAGLTRRRMDSDPTSYMDRHAIDDRYTTLFAGDQPGMVRESSTGSMVENMAKNMYGMSSYRHMNVKARMARGDLGEYDDLFPDREEFWQRLHTVGKMKEEGDPDWVGEADNLVDMWSDLDADVNGGMGLFGLSHSDSRTYYEELVGQFISHAGTDDLGRNFNAAERSGMFRINNHSDMLKILDGSMRPTQHETFQWRISSADWMGLDRLPDERDIGHIFQDDAYISTEGRPEYFIGAGVNSLSTIHRGVRYMIHMPEGTMGSRVNLFENEVILPRNTRFQVLNVVDLGDMSDFKKEVHLSVIHQEPSWKPGHAFIDKLSQELLDKLDPTFKGDDDEIWDAVMGDF